MENKETSDTNKRISLFKLHGSLNWRICPVCKEAKLYYYELKRADGTDKLYDETYSDLFLPAISVCMKNKKHKRYNYVENTLFVPPSEKSSNVLLSSNENDYPCIKILWKKASEELKNADKVVFIGYSLPPIDASFKYLLLSSLPKNISAEVVDPDVQNTAGCYLEIFKDKISFKAMKFEEYIRGFLS